MCLACCGRIPRPTRTRALNPVFPGLYECLYLTWFICLCVPTCLCVSDCVVWQCLTLSRTPCMHCLILSLSVALPPDLPAVLPWVQRCNWSTQTTNTCSLDMHTCNLPCLSHTNATRITLKAINIITAQPSHGLWLLWSHCGNFTCNSDTISMCACHCGREVLTAVMRHSSS